ncbi:MAG: tyrosine-type recombinase/integrase [Clostridiales bacterium]|nr:tyrosine-type recombinase/integrase [Clostridiales bacterium]
MEQYDKNVTVILEFLVAESFSASVISLHRLCYKALRNHLTEEKIFYSLDAAYRWIDDNKACWNYRQHTGWRHCVDQLEDIYANGHILPDHLGVRKSAYCLLSEALKAELDDFLDNGLVNPDDGRYRISCARFLLYLQYKGFQSISQLDYSGLLSFHKDDYHKSSISKDVYEDLIRVFLRYGSYHGKCSPGFSLALNKLLIHQIVEIPDTELSGANQTELPVISWSIIETFLKEMAKARYKKTVLKSTRYILTLCYIFLDMHSFSRTEENLWLWFNHVKPFLGAGWKQHRRSLCQFLHYLKTGIITTTYTGDPSYVPPVDRLPVGACDSIRSYLALLEREGWKKSTITMYRSCCIRFCQYLQEEGINDFCEITTDTLQDFNRKDIHATPEGKAAYNCRIRCFLIYLYEQGMVCNPYLYKALPTLSAPRTVIVQTLSQEDLAYIWSVNSNTLSPIELRDFAIVCVGLTMGFRASDIVSLRFANIDWTRRSICLTQEKTGKNIILPMPVRTGNILFRYLRDGRPESADIHVFIKHKAPFKGLHRCVCAKALKRFLPQADAYSNGFHVLRRTFATNLLRGNTKVELIADSLGHSTDSTVHKYLSLDEERMRQCPISLGIVGISLKGGVFHA